MPLGKVLYESGMPMGHVYFPTTSIVSLLYVMEDGASAEIAVVGNEGIVGIALFMGGETTPQPIGRAKRRRGLPHGGATAQGRVQPLRSGAASAFALHAGPDHANGPDGGVQSATIRSTSSCAAGCC